MPIYLDAISYSPSYLINLYLFVLLRRPSLKKKVINFDSTTALVLAKGPFTLNFHQVLLFKYLIV